jgi:hypothetical protein
MKQQYLVILEEGDGQPLTSYDCFGMAEVREQIKTTREDWAHYDTLRFRVNNEANVCVIDRTYRSKKMVAS